MRLYGLFIRRTSDPDGTPELVECWDEFSLDENYEGWVEAQRSHLALIGDDVAAKVVAEIVIPDAAIRDALNPRVVVAAEILSVEVPS